MSGYRYGAGDVQRLVALCWFPEDMSYYRDPFGLVVHDEAADRKGTLDPSTEGDSMAELVDVRKALAFDEKSLQLVRNNALLSDGEMRAMFLRYAMDIEVGGVAHILEVSEGQVRAWCSRGVEKILRYMNSN